MSKHYYLSILLVWMFGFSIQSYSQERVTFTLEEMVARAKARSPAALRAQTRKENRYWNYRFYQSNYNPQLRLSGTIPGFSQAFNNVTQPDGTIEFREVRQNFMDLELGIEQEIAATGGNISISGASGTGGAYKIGDTISATWNNTAGGDNNTGITGVTADFSQFGGGAFRRVREAAVHQGGDPGDDDDQCSDACDSHGAGS